MTFYGNAPYSFPEGLQRISWYGFSGTPSVMFDGVDDYVGGAASGSMYTTYLPTVVSRQSVASPLIMDANFVILGNQITMTVNVQVDMPVTTSNNQVHFFVAREGYHSQSNLVIDMLDSEPLALTTPGESTLITREFTLDPAIIDDNLRLIAVAQSMSSKEILQGTLAVADYAATVVVDCDPDGVLAPWRLQGPEGLDMVGEGDKTLNVFFAGEYTLTWLDVPFWTTPDNTGNTQTVLEDGTITFVGQYSNGPFTTVTAGPLGNVDFTQGTSLVDFDNDGDLDIHVIIDDAPDQLLRNDGNNVFVDVASGLIADAGDGRASTWADYNRDGFQDVYLGKIADDNILLNGDGTGGFVPANAIGIGPAGPTNSVSWVDYDLDGNLDLYLGTTSGPNALLDSYGDLGGGFFVFSPVPGVTADLSNCKSATWTDGNLDGRLDLYLVNSFSANVMLENTPIGFSDISGSSGLDDVTNSTGAAWGDLDNDGDFDLYLTNDGMADKLFRCNGDFLYTQVPGVNVTDMGHGRGVQMVDLNNDMYLDIYVVRNGQPDLLLMNNGDFTFTQAPVGPPEADGPGNALVAGDLDNDGSVDLFITRVNNTNVLLKNDLGQANNWFDLRLIGAENQPDAIGARVVLTAGGVSQSRLLVGAGYQGMSSRVQSFGLGSNSQVDQIDIYWPDGTLQSVGPFVANMHLQVTQGENPASPVGDDLDGLPRATVLGKAHPNPFNPSTTIEFALAKSGPTRLDVFDLNGRLVHTLVSESLTAGHHSATWTGQDQTGRPVASGAYFYRLQAADGAVQSGRMVLVK